MKKFQKDNPKMDATMRTHLIDNLEEFGVFSDDYGTFCRKRAERISEEIQKRIIKKK